MNTALPIARVNASFVSGANLILLCLVAVGWSYSVLQLLALDAAGSLAEAGPGMQIFAAFQYYLLQDPFGFETSAYFCATTETTWGILDFIKSFAMWAAMVMAMMLPTLFPLIRDLRARNQNTAPFILGYLAVWLMFCVMGVGVQWVLRLLEVLNGHMVITDPVISAVVLCLAGAYQFSAYKLNGLKERNKITDGTSEKPCCQDVQCGSGTIYGFACLRCCWPLMLSMFAFGLMNILAMGVLAVIMFMETTSFSRIKLAKIWGGVAFALGALFYVQSV